MSSILSLLNSAVSAVSSWFVTILESTGTASLYISMMTIVLTIGYFLIPVLGNSRQGFAGGSDFAASSYQKVNQAADDYRTSRDHSREGLERISRGR